jgi:hypothetical protein
MKSIIPGSGYPTSYIVVFFLIFNELRWVEFIPSIDKGGMLTITV